MSGLAAAALSVWFALTLFSLVLWLRRRRVGQHSGAPTRHADIAVVAIMAVGTGAVALLAGLAPPLTGAWAWVGVLLAAAAAVLVGGAVTRRLLDIADAFDSGRARVQKDVLRGGAWIGGLERLGLLVSVLTHWPEGIAVLIAIKGLARYPELKTGQGTGAAERFIIGTFASMGVAAVSAGIAFLLR